MAKRSRRQKPPGDASRAGRVIADLFALQTRQLEALRQFLLKMVKEWQDDVVHRAIQHERSMKERRRTGGTARGRQIAAKAAAKDTEIRRHYNRWQMSDELQDTYPSVVAYLRTKTGLPLEKVRRRLKTLRLPTKRQ